MAKAYIKLFGMRFDFLLLSMVSSFFKRDK